MTLASDYIRKEDIEAVRSDLEDVFLTHIEDNFDSEVEARDISVEDAKKEASKRHERINNKVQNLGAAVSGLMSLLGFTIFAPVYTIYAYFFRKEVAERQELIDYCSYDQEEGAKIADEYRKSWNRSMKNTTSLFGVLFLVILRDVSPRFYNRSIGILNRVFENEDVIIGDDNWVNLVFKHSSSSK